MQIFAVSQRHYMKSGPCLASGKEGIWGQMPPPLNFGPEVNYTCREFFSTAGP